jgi:hypothetical protein
MRPARPDDFRLPELHFVNVSSLVPHEQHDSQRMGPLVEQFRQGAVLMNPPVVTPLPEGGSEPRYMVLDGANRSTAAREAGFPHVVVQLARYEEPWVQLSTWHHALSGIDCSEMRSACSKIPGLECVDEPLLHAQAQLARREVLAYAVHEADAVTAFRGGRDLPERNQLLNAIVDIYREGRRFYRMSTESFDVARERHPDVTALVVFPHFEPAEVIELAGNGARLPAGITRHLIRWRALRVNVPLSAMADRTRTLEEKNRWLEGWVGEKYVHRQVRFYEEPTVLFDE